MFGKIIIISLILIIGIIYLVYGSLDYKSVKIILILGAGLFLWSQKKKMINIFSLHGLIKVND